jgi:hypothetical protein
MITKKLYKKSLLITSSILLFHTFVSADISGIIYKDFNLDGLKNGEDLTLSNIPVTAVCSDETTHNTQTDTDGIYIFSDISEEIYCRVEANPSYLGLKSASNNAGSSPLVDRVLNGTMNHNISVASVGMYCQENPNVLAVAIPARTDTSHTYEPDGYMTLLKVPKPQSDGTINGQETINSTRNILATYDETGSAWGLAYKKDSKDIFMAAVLKPNANLGSDGIGAIYKITSTGILSTFTTIPNSSSNDLNTFLENRDITNSVNEKSVYPFIAREGLGDIEISEDDTILYALNLNEKSVVEINATNGNILKTTLLPNPYGDTCPNDDVRPWALSVKGKDLYIGSVCESKITPDNNGESLGAAIQKYNGAIIFTNTLSYLKPYKKDPTFTVDGYMNYHSWDSDYTEPILTDIAFSNTGDLILSYSNRLAFSRTGDSDFNILNGDIRKMCLNTDGTYTDESTQETPTSCSSFALDYDGGEIYNEFYVGDFYGTDYGKIGHPETAGGALAQQPGKPYITTTMIDGTSLEEAGTIAQFSHLNGEKIGVQALLKNLDTDQAESEVYGRKAGGLGDIELMCDPAPIEIGNYVWIDMNENGIQDPNEIPLNDIIVTLWDNEILIGTTTTDSTGHYYFGGIDNVHLNNTSLTRNHTYTVKIDRTQDTITLATTKNVNNNNDDVRDSDADTDTQNLFITFTTGINNDHSLDFGIVPVKIGNRVWIEDDYDGDATTGNITPVVNTLVTAQCGNLRFTDTTDTNGYYEIHVPTNIGTCIVSVDIPENTVPTIGADNNSVPDNNSEDNKNHNNTGTTVTVKNTDNMTLDFGFVPSVKIGNKVWIEDDNDGDATTGNITHVIGTSVTATCGTQTYSATTNILGLYEILVPSNIGICNVKVPTPLNTIPTAGSTDNNVADTISEENKTHDGRGTTVNVGTVDNMTLDFGFLGARPKISGTLFHDGNGDNNVNGSPFNKPDGTQLYVNLIDINGKVLAAKPLANDGTYEFNFNDGVRANSCYTVVLSQIQGNIGSNTPSTTLPIRWNNTGENLNNSSSGHDGNKDGKIKVCIGTLDIPHVDLGINKAPTTEDNSRPIETNPGENICVTTPNLSNQDYEDGSISSVTILDLPTEGILYYNGTLVQPNMIISNFNNSKLCADPYDGDVDVIFTYSVTDREGIQSNISTISMPFSVAPYVTPTPTPTPKPIQPVETVSDLSETSVTIHWSNQNNENGYKIYQDGKLIAVVPEDTTSYTLENLQSAKSYTYIIYVLDNTGETKIMETTITTKIVDWLVPIYYIILN